MDRSVFANGSSPLTRGKREITPDVSVDDGLIPAHAGKTSHHPLASGRGAAHPRSRGENGGCLPDLLPALGSSPLTRGKHSSCAKFSHVWRLIPAHAGKTVRQYGEGPSLRAHPRSRGENLSESMGVSSDQGSSPLTRGKPGVWGAAGRSVRLIPAHAGKTGRSVAQAAHREGSSPLTRGKLNQSFRFSAGSRLIPAHAGKTLRPEP